MRIFLAGIMQGSFREMRLHSQEYRTILKTFLEEHLPGAEVFDPFENHQNSIHYSDEEGKKVFLGHNFLCREMDVILAFVPEASMGTAIEIWEGWLHGAAVFIITPLVQNWAVKFLSHHIYASIDELKQEVLDGQFLERVQQVQESKQSNLSAENHDSQAN